MELQIAVVKIRRVCLAIALILLCGSLTAQENLVVNGGFETIVNCEINYGIIESAEGWFPFYSASTPDLFNECATTNNLSIPDNNGGSQETLTGSGYAGFNPSISAIGISESLLGTLNGSLQKDTLYYVSFHLSLADRWQKAMRDIGLVFLDSSYTINSDSFYTVAPDLVEHEWITDKIGWHLVDTVYKATGNETHLAIGYFPNENIYETLPGQGGDINSTYYYVDDVKVIPYSVWLGTGSQLSIEKEELSIYPNPTTSTTTLTWQGQNHGNYQLHLYDVHGKLLLRETLPSAQGSKQIDLSAYAKGIYFGRLLMGEKDRPFGSAQGKSFKVVRE